MYDFLDSRPAVSGSAVLYIDKCGVCYRGRAVSLDGKGVHTKNTVYTDKHGRDMKVQRSIKRR